MRAAKSSYFAPLFFQGSEFSPLRRAFTNPRRPPRVAGGVLGYERACKPGSVERGHLSTPAVTGRLQRYSRTSSGGQPYVKRPQTCIGRGLHGTACYQAVGELLPRLSILAIIRLAADIGRSISVALSLKSPSPDVIRRPALRCPDFPHRAEMHAATA